MASDFDRDNLRKHELANSSSKKFSIFYWGNLMKLRPKRVVITATREELTRESYLYRLWTATKSMGFSRRQWLNDLAAGIYDFDGKIVMADGRVWPVPDIDAVMGNDADFRWLSYYLEEHYGMPKRKIKTLERLRVLDLYFRISRPNIARHFGK